MFDSYIMFSSCLEKVIAPIDLAVMASYHDSTSGRVDFAEKEKHVSEESLDELLKAHPELILLKNFHDMSKKNPRTKESEGPPRKESVRPPRKESLPLPLNIIPDDGCSSNVGDMPTCSDTMITSFTDYASE